MLLDWITKNWIEVCGAVTGLLYLLFSIRQHLLTWPVGLVTSLFYISVFFSSKFYADMGLQVYYVFISIYGWWNWLHGSASGNELHVSRTDLSLWVRFFVINIFLFAFISWILVSFTDSPIPYWDAFTTALSIVATWMLARKKVEHWILWIVVDSVSLVLYFIKGLYPTTLLFLVYTLLAIAGFISWNKELNERKWISETI
jgi:nicotinamide mononucleotide transporter